MIIFNQGMLLLGSNHFLNIRYVTTDDHYKIFVQEQTRLVVCLPDKVNTQLFLFIYSRTEKQNEGMKN